MLIGKGQVFGEEALLKGIASVYTIRCKSAMGELLAISELEFNRKIKHNDETMKVLEEICQQKATVVLKTIN